MQKRPFKSVVLFFTFFSNVAFAEVTATNGIYTLYVEDAAGGIGTFTVATGSSHPNPDENVLFAGASGDAWSTYLTVRSYSSETDYVSTSDIPSSGFTVLGLDNFAPAISSLGTSGFSTTWTVTGSDTLTIEQVTNIEGTTVDDSLVRVTTTVTNNGSGPVQIGIRYLWDWQINDSDDSQIKRHLPDDAAFTSDFFEEAPPTFQYYEETNNSASFSVFGSVSGPAGLSPAPTTPDRINYSSWSDAFDTAWTFTVTGAGLDSAVCYYWGDSDANAISLDPGQSYSVTQYITTFEQSLGAPRSVSAPAMGSGGMVLFAVLAGLVGVYFVRRKALVTRPT